MTTNYPGSLDSFTNPTSADILATAGGSIAIPHASQHSNLNDAVLAIQTKLGTTTTKATFPAGITISTAPLAATDAATKGYVDAAITGLNIHESCEVATTAAFASVSYADGVTLDITGGYGPGATLTNTGTLAAFTLDGYTPAQYDRILVKNQADARQNGIYSLTAVGSGLVAWVLTRTSDYDNGSALEVNSGDFIFVIHGTTNIASSWVQTNEGSYTGAPQGGIIIKSSTGDNLTFSQVTGAGSSATNLAGTTQYSIPYQTSSGVTGYLSIGSANQLLAVNSTTNGYTWTSPSSLTIGTATNAANVANATTTSGSTFYINFGATNTTTNQGTNTNASLTYVPSTGTLSASVISGGALGGSLLNTTTIGAVLAATATTGSLTYPARADHVHPTTGLVTTFAGGTTGLTPASATSGAISLAGTLVVANGGTGTGTAGITAFNNITGYTAAGATGTTSTNLVFSTSPTLTTPKIDSIVTNTGAATVATLFGDVTTGSITVGSTLTGNITLAGATGFTGTFGIANSSTSAHTVGISNGAGTTNKTISIGTSSTGGTTAITLGSSSGATSTITLNGTVNTTSGSFKVGNTTLAQGVNGTITFPASTDTLVGRATTDPLTNKDLTSPTNTFPAQIVAGKNAIINGGMDIWQRNTSFAANGTPLYTADRWGFYRASSGVGCTVTRQTSGLTGVKYTARVQRDSGNTAVTLLNFYQTVETLNALQYAGKTLTLSFYARSGANFSQTASQITAQVQYGTGTDENFIYGFTGATDVANSAVTISSVWARYQITTSALSTSATEIGLNFSYTPVGTALAADYFEITGVQLELGSTATTFSRSGGSINGEETAVGSAAQDGILYSQNASSNPSGSGSNAWAGYGVAGKNAVINGGMDIWQRGTSIAIASNSVGYSADRMYITAQLNSASTVSRQATADTTNLPNIQYCARVQRNAGQTGTGNAISQSMETINSIPFAGKQVTLSFYARAGANYSPTANALSVVLYSGTGTEQNINGGFTGQATPIATSATLTTTWQRFSFTGTIATTATELAFYFSANSTGTAGANDYFEITGVQLELGSTATTFSRAGGSIGVELALCQRYYYQIGGTTFALQDFGNGHYYSLGAAYILTTFPVPMRVAPTTACLNPTSFSVYSAGTGRAVTTFTISSSSPFNATALFATAAATAGNGCWLEATNANATLTYSAEL